MTIAVLFDLEDTLVQTPWSDFQHVTEFRRNTREKLVELGIPRNELEGIERATLMRNKASEYIEKHFTRTEKDKFRQEMEEFLSRYELDSARKSKLFPDTVPTLKQLKKIEVRIGLVTNTSAKAVEIVSQLHGLKHYFDVVITRENVARLKPDSEGILLAVKKLGAKDFFMIGDLPLDAQAAKNAKGTSIIIIRRNPDERLDFQADHVIRSLNSVIPIIRAALKSKLNS
jgi:HAD superfamily hydrolase (TIGR01549 family)